MDDLELNRIGAFESALQDTMNSAHADLMETLNAGDWDDEIEGQLKAAVKAFKSTGSW